MFTVSTILFIFAVTLQSHLILGEDVKEVYQVLRDTIGNATIEGLKALKEYERDDVVGSINAVVDSIKDDMAERYDWKLNTMEEISENATKHGINITACLRKFQHQWLQAWIDQTAVADKVGAETKLHSSEIIRRVVGAVQESYDTIFQYEDEVANCVNSKSQETCAPDLIKQMKKDTEIIPDRIDRATDGLEDILSSLVTYMYYALTSASDTLGQAAREAIGNVTECANGKPTLFKL